MNVGQVLAKDECAIFFLLPRKRSVLLAYWGSISIGVNENTYFGKLVSLLFPSKIYVLVISFKI